MGWILAVEILKLFPRVPEIAGVPKGPPDTKLPVLSSKVGCRIPVRVLSDFEVYN